MVTHVEVVNKRMRSRSLMCGTMFPSYAFIAKRTKCVQRKAQVRQGPSSRSVKDRAADPPKGACLQHALGVDELRFRFDPQPLVLWIHSNPQWIHSNECSQMHAPTHMCVCKGMVQHQPTLDVEVCWCLVAEVPSRASSTNKMGSRIDDKQSPATSEAL